MTLFLDDILERGELECLIDIDQMGIDNFCSIAEKLKLNPRKDFQNADLRNVDFSDCDLSDYDFSGSDLSNSFGVNIKFPPVEAFEGTTLDESPFSLFVLTDKIIENDSKLKKEIQIGCSEDALEASQWILSVSKDDNRSKEELSAISTRLFDTTKFRSVKNSVLYGSLNYLRLDDFRKFLLHLFATQTDDIETIRSSLSLLAKVFPNDEDVLKYPLAIIRSDNRPPLILAAVEAVYASNFFRKNLILVRDALLAPSKYEFRQALLRSAVGSQSNYSWPLLYDIEFAPFPIDPDKTKFLDFAKVVDSDLLLGLASRANLRDIVKEEQLRGRGDRKMSLAQQYQKITRDKVGNIGNMSRALTVMSDAFSSLYALHGIKFEFSDEALSLISPKDNTFVSSQEFYKNVRVGARNMSRWSNVAAFF